MNNIARGLVGVSIAVWVLLGAAATAPAHAEPIANVSLEPSHLIVADYGDGSFDIQVELTNLNHRGQITYDDDRDTVPDRAYESYGLGAYEFELHFNPGVLRVAGAEPSDFAGSTGRNFQCIERNTTPGEYALGCFSLGSARGPQGSGRLATITLVPLANGLTPLALEAGLGGPLGDEIPVEASGTVVLVSGASTEAPTPGPNPTPGPGAGPGGNGEPSVIGNGEPGGIDLPEGDSGQAQAIDLESGVAAAGANGASGDQDFPSAGTGHPTGETTPWPFLTGGALAAAGAILLFAGSRVAGRSHRS